MFSVVDDYDQDAYRFKYIYFFTFISKGKSVKKKVLSAMMAYPGQTPNPNGFGTIVHCPLGLSITAGCDTARERTRNFSGASSTAMQCLCPLRHSGAVYS
jgi:hypothetical protein